MRGDAQLPDLSEVRSICGKGDAEPFWISRYLIRPWTMYLSYIALRCGLSPSTVTVASAILAVSAGFLTLWPSPAHYVGAAAMTLGFFILDHVDGEMARILVHVAPSTTGKIDLSGKYLDRLVHYLQAPSLFLGMSIGVAMAENQAWWGALGILCGIGSGGFPRFTASYDLLVASAQRHVSNGFLREVSGFNTVYGSSLLGRSFFLFPRSKQDLLTLARQYAGFPGNLFVISGALVFDGVAGAATEFRAVKLVLGIYALILSANLIYAARKYFSLLEDVPE